MHELSLCCSIRDIVERAREGRPVTSVQVQVGRLRQVVPETLEYCWTMVTDSSPLAGSALEIEHVPVVVECHDCGASTTLEEVLVLTCGDCGSARTVVVSGEELMVTSVDLAETGA
jgi:hydrogenase nickel incorporation protein HypA/HybF